MQAEDSLSRWAALAVLVAVPILLILPALRTRKTSRIPPGSAWRSLGPADGAETASVDEVLLVGSFPGGVAKPRSTDSQKTWYDTMRPAILRRAAHA